MKVTKLLIVYFAAGISFFSAGAQTQLTTNCNLNIVTANAGVVTRGNTIDLLITCANTGANPIQPNRIRPSISIPIAIASAAPNALQTGLPPGWVISTNTGGVISVCNGTDVIPAGATREIIIKIEGNTEGGPSTISGNLLFGNGTSCTAFGGSLNGDNPADNSSSTTITVTSAPLPLTLLSFNAALTNCKASLNWTTESEINTDLFQIERSDITTGNADWKTVGEVFAKGTLPKSTYNYLDATVDEASVKVFYRLKIIDKDGSYKYSDILPLSVNCNGTQVTVYPNPVRNGKVHVTLSGATKITEAVLMSAAGQQVLKTKITNGSNYLSVSNIADGVYYLHIKEINGADKKIKLLIQK